MTEALHRTATSADGTQVAYRSVGAGSGLIVVGGAMRTAEDYLPLAHALARSFEVHVMERRGRVQSRDALLRDVWEYDNFIDTRTVDTHMRRLRDKLGDAARYLDTVRGVGNRFVDKT